MPPLSSPAALDWSRVKKAASPSNTSRAELTVFKLRYTDTKNQVYLATYNKCAKLKADVEALKAMADVDATSESHLTQEVARLEEANTTLNQRVDELSAAVADQRAAHDRDIADLRAAHDRALADQRAAHDRDIADLRAAHDRALADQRAAHDRDIADLRAMITQQAASTTRAQVENAFLRRQLHDMQAALDRCTCNRPPPH